MDVLIRDIVIATRSITGQFKGNQSLTESSQATRHGVVKFAQSRRRNLFYL